MKFLFSPKALIVISWVMMLVALVGMVLTQLRVIATEEPIFVLQLSWFAVFATGYGNIISANINKNVKEGNESTT